MDGRRDLFAQPGVHEMGIALDPRGHFSTAKVVKEADFLRQGGLQEPLSDPPGSQLGSDLPDDHVSVSADQHSETDVDEVRGVEGGIVQDRVLGFCDGDRVIALEKNPGEIGKRGGKSTCEEQMRLISE